MLQLGDDIGWATGGDGGDGEGDDEGEETEEDDIQQRVGSEVEDEETEAPGRAVVAGGVAEEREPPSHGEAEPGFGDAWEGGSGECSAQTGSSAASSDAYGHDTQQSLSFPSRPSPSRPWWFLLYFLSFLFCFLIHFFHLLCVCVLVLLVTSEVKWKWWLQLITCFWGLFSLFQFNHPDTDREAQSFGNGSCRLSRLCLGNKSAKVKLGFSLQNN